MKGESKGVRVACLEKKKKSKIMQSSSVMPGFLEINVLIIKTKKTRNIARFTSSDGSWLFK